jgi:chaperonin GroES
MALNIQPLSDRVLIKLLQNKKKQLLDFYIPDTAKEKPQQGKVVAVGKARKTTT